MDKYIAEEMEGRETILDLYNSNYTTSNCKVKLGGVVVALMMLSTPISIHGAGFIIAPHEPVSTMTPSHNFANYLSTSDKTNISPLKGYPLAINRAAPYERAEINYSHFLTSFKENTKSGMERMAMEPLFTKMAKGLEQLKITKSFVDTSYVKGLIEFHLNLGKGIYVSVLKGWDTLDTDIVEFTVSVDNDMTTAGFISMEELSEKLMSLQNSLHIV